MRSTSKDRMCKHIANGLKKILRTIISHGENIVCFYQFKGTSLVQKI